MEKVETIFKLLEAGNCNNLQVDRYPNGFTVTLPDGRYFGVSRVNNGETQYIFENGGVSSEAALKILGL